MKRYLGFLLTGILLTSCRTRESIPDITLLMPDSASYVNIAKIPKGKTILLMYYHPYCQACRAEWQGIAENINLLKDIQICLITDQPFADMLAFYKNYELKQYDNVMVGRDTGYKFNKLYKPKGVPYNVFFDKKGLFRGGGMMVLNFHQIDSLINKL